MYRFCLSVCLFVLSCAPVLPSRPAHLDPARHDGPSAPLADMSLATGDEDVEATAHARQYTCPMHPEIVRDEPGLCPQCNMRLVETGE